MIVVGKSLCFHCNEVGVETKDTLRLQTGWHHFYTRTNTGFRVARFLWVWTQFHDDNFTKSFVWSLLDASLCLMTSTRYSDVIMQLRAHKITLFQLLNIWFRKCNVKVIAKKLYSDEIGQKENGSSLGPCWQHVFMTKTPFWWW